MNNIENPPSTVVTSTNLPIEKDVVYIQTDNKLSKSVQEHVKNVVEPIIQSMPPGSTLKVTVIHAEVTTPSD